MAFGWQSRRVLIVVRTYPVPAQKGAETSCTAAISDSGEWIRIFPVPYRSLPDEKRFSKYQWIDVALKKAAHDPRPESFNLDIESIKLRETVPSLGEWSARRHLLRPLTQSSLCAIRRERDEKGHPTLGFFKPGTIKRLVIQADARDWTPAQKTILTQGTLGFMPAPKQELEKIPYAFSYEFVCAEHGCRGHTMSCTDWEMAEAYRRWRRDYGDDWEKPFRQRFEHEMIERNDTHFYVGTMHGHPSTWIIVGLFYPPKHATLELFD